MNIVFCTDNQYEQVGTSMVSIFEHCTQQINVYLLTAKESDEISDLYKLANHYNQTFKHIIIDKTNLPFLSLINIADDCHPALGKTLPDSAYYRWLIQDYIDDNKCLYLDTDVLVNQDITEFYNTDMSNYSICGSRGLVYPTEIVTGVLLMNLDYFRKHNVFDKLVQDTINKHNNNDRINDQYILNEVLNDSKLIMPDNYMLQALYLNLQFAKKLDIWKFIHYADFRKPWKCKMKWDEIWHDYNKIYKQIKDNA